MMGVPRWKSAERPFAHVILDENVTMEALDTTSSICNSMLLNLRCSADLGRKKECAYQVNHTSRAGLLTGLLGEEQETLSSVRCPRGVVVSMLGLLTTEVA
jgi:hypothetical protein